MGRRKQHQQLGWKDADRRKFLFFTITGQSCLLPAYDNEHHGHSPESISISDFSPIMNRRRGTIQPTKQEKSLSCLCPDRQSLLCPLGTGCLCAGPSVSIPRISSPRFASLIWAPCPWANSQHLCTCHYGAGAAAVPAPARASTACSSSGQGQRTACPSFCRPRPKLHLPAAPGRAGQGGDPVPGQGPAQGASLL